MIKTQTLKGFRDFLPYQARKRQYVIQTLTTVFKNFGFEPLETPVLEYEELLMGKYGDEGDQLMYRFEDNGKRRVAMRYDQTVPLARVISQYKNELPLPFKRYQIQNVWRAENTQKGRFREFLQCDIDIVGTKNALSDAEIIAVAAKSLEALGVQNYKILLNDRHILFGITLDRPIPEETLLSIIIALDKLKKIGKDAVIKEIENLGFSSQEATTIFTQTESAQLTPILKEIMDHLKEFGIKQEHVEFFPVLARGLNYYTDLIFEIEIDGYTAGSIAGGGRYDNLIGMFSGEQTPAVGFAFGFDRLMEAMNELKLFPSEVTDESTKVLVTIFSKAVQKASMDTISKLREASIPSEVYLGEVKDKNPLEKQLKYALTKQIPYMVIIGPDEAKKELVTLKNLVTREQKQMSIDELIKHLK